MGRHSRPRAASRRHARIKLKPADSAGASRLEQRLVCRVCGAPGFRSDRQRYIDADGSEVLVCCNLRAHPPTADTAALRVAFSDQEDTRTLCGGVVAVIACEGLPS